MRIIFTLAGLLLLGGVAAGVEVTSPDGRLTLSFEIKDSAAGKACPFYRVSRGGTDVLKDSLLGLDLEPHPLRGGLSIAGQTRSSHDSTWKPVCGERDVVRDHYNELAVDLKENDAPHRLVRLTFRAYDAGIAFCYTLPAQPALKDFTIAAERTQFCFPADATTWAVYSAQGDYTPARVPLSAVKPGVERPLTVQLGSHLYTAITEARTVDYARMKLRPVTGEPFALEAFLDAERGRAGKVAGATPFTSPWRVVMVADSPGGLLQSDWLIPTLNDPCALSDTSWIKPGKVIRETTLTTAGGKACVDFCVQRGMQFVELDAGWYGPESDPASDARAVDPKKASRLDLHEVIRYAAGHGIGVILYVNRRALERQADELFPLYESWGVKGVKFGFVNVGSQQWTAWVHEDIRKAAAHHLMVDIHDEFRNTGYQRTFPNLMTVEGIGGNETFPTPVHNATLAFTRFLTGPADYTYCWYSPKLKVTHAHQLALTTIYFSPWQFLFWYDRPADYKGDPALDYWKVLPTCWDETRVLAGEIGRYVSVARRHGEDWYIGSIRPDGRGELDVPLSFLPAGKKYAATIYSDQAPDDPGSKAVRIEQMTVDAATVLKAHMPPDGGQAVRLVPASTTAR